MRAVITIYVFLLAASCAVTASADTITHEMRSRDERLERRISVKFERVRVGELLLALSRQTGVRIEADEEEGAGEFDVLAALPNVKLGDALDALWSFFSNVDAEWDWARKGEAPNYRYVLRRNVRARQYAGELRSRVQGQFEAEAQRLCDYATMDRRDLEKAGERDPTARELVMLPARWAAADVFARNVPPEDRLKLLRGETRRYRVPIDELSDAARNILLDNWAKSRGFRTINGVLEPIPPPRFFTVQRMELPVSRIAPSIFLLADGAGGSSFLGGYRIQKALSEELTGAWKLPGDSAESDIEIEKLKSPLGPEGEPPGGSMDMVMRSRLVRLSDAAGFPLIAQLPMLSGGSSWDPALNPEGTVGAVVKQFLDHPTYLLRKWRNGTLCLRYVGWFKDEADNIPEWMVKRLSAARSPDGILPVSEIIQAAQTLTRGQLLWLGHDFPVLNNVAQYYNLLNSVRDPAKLEQLQSETGLPLTPEISAALYKDERVELTRVIEEGSARAIRLEVRSDVPGGDVSFGFILADGRWRPVVGFVLRPPAERPPLSDRL